MLEKIKKIFKKEAKTESPDEIFKRLKANKHAASEEDLNDYKSNLEVLASEFIKTGQYKSLEKVAFLIKCVEDEKKLVSLGINQYVFRDDIDEFLSRRDIEESSIRLIELSDYPRRIPADIQEKILKTKDVFSHMYVMFTDYTGNVTKNHMREKEIEKKDKDPILFGTFQTTSSELSTFLGGKDVVERIPTRLLNDKFYVVGDWVDEYCDLTLDKFVALSGKDDIVSDIKEPATLDDIQKALTAFKEIPEVD